MRVRPMKTLRTAGFIAERTELSVPQVFRCPLESTIFLSYDRVKMTFPSRELTTKLSYNNLKNFYRLS